jgi:hypothetical protein
LDFSIWKAGKQENLPSGKREGRKDSFYQESGKAGREARAIPDFPIDLLHLESGKAGREFRSKSTGHLAGTPITCP